MDHQETKASGLSAQFAKLADYFTDLDRRDAGTTAAGVAGIVVTGIGDCRGPLDCYDTYGWPFC